MPLELDQLDLRYASLRIADPVRRARLEQAIAQQGQQVPVLVVPLAAASYVCEGAKRPVREEGACRDT